MHTLYLIAVWLHLVAVAAWLGGMLFLAAVLMPWMRADRSRSAALRDIGLRFRTVGWISLGVLLLTGTFNLYVRGVRWHHLVDAAFLSSPFGRTLAFKLSLYACVLGVSFYHDFIGGPRASELLTRDPTSTDAQRARRRASWIGRATAALALLIVAAGVVLVRGCV